MVDESLWTITPFILRMKYSNISQTSIYFENHTDENKNEIRLSIATHKCTKNAPWVI